jgi:hypothetical protein
MNKSWQKMRKFKQFFKSFLNFLYFKIENDNSLLNDIFGNVKNTNLNPKKRSLTHTNISKCKLNGNSSSVSRTPTPTPPPPPPTELQNNLSSCLNTTNDSLMNNKKRFKMNDLNENNNNKSKF